MMVRTATTEQIAAALHVRPATVRKYAREHRLPFDLTPGGHRRFDVDEAVTAMRGERPDRTAGRGSDLPLLDPVPYVRVEPKSEVTAVAVVSVVEDADIVVRDDVRLVEDWATEHPVV
jgi:hypothetical protein